MDMQALGKIFALRTAVAALLALFVLANLAFVNHHELAGKLTPLLAGLDAAIDTIMLDRYASLLKEEMLAAKKKELLEEIKKTLTAEYKDKMVEDLKKDLAQLLKPDVAAQLKAQLAEEYLRVYATTHKLNYNLLEDMKSKYYEENKDRIKNLQLLEALDAVLGDRPADEQHDLKQKVADELEATMSRKEWFLFVLRDLIKASAPRMDKLSAKERGDDIRGCAFVVNPATYDELFLSRMNLDEKRMDDFRSTHEKLVSKLHLMDVPPTQIFNGVGIVISAGGAYMAGALVTIIQTREVGSTLPIEVMINTREEYDKHICETLGAKFNFKCVIIEEEIGHEVIQELKITKFQLKILGLLVTSFDHVIALDADNMPLKNPDTLFSTKEYLNTRFLLWPDLWQRTISTSYYDIAGIKAGEPVRRHGIHNSDDFAGYLKKGAKNVHFHDREGVPSAVSTETGQMVFSKREHFRSFILALYYNIYGATHYWRFFYQGSPGTGDRDTFVPALHVFNEPYHVVDHATWLAGFQTADNKFQETTIVQYDPTSAANFKEEWLRWLLDRGLDLRMPYDENTQHTRSLVAEFLQQKGDLVTTPDVFFLHIHRPKINPILATDPEGYFEWNKQRNLGLPGAYKDDFGETDWDLKFYTISQWVACSGIQSEAWWKSVNRDQKKVCEEAKNYVEFLKKDSPDKKAQEFTNVALT